MEPDEIEEARDLAQKHWEWLEGLLRKMYIDAFVHGFKHGQEDK
jgi:hypothetical protein